MGYRFQMYSSSKRRHRKSASDPVPRIPSRRHLQGDRLLSVPSGLGNSQPPGRLGLNDDLTAYLSKIRNLCGPDPSHLTVYEVPAITNLPIPDHPLPGPTVYSGADLHRSTNTCESALNATVSNDVEVQEDASWLLAPDAEIYGDFPNAQGMAYGNNLLADATPYSGLDSRGTGNLEDFTAGTADFNSGSLCCTSYPYPTSFNTTNFNSFESSTFAPSYTHTPVYFDQSMGNFIGPGSSDIPTPTDSFSQWHIAPNTSFSTSLESPGIPDLSHSSTAHCPTRNMTYLTSLGPSGTSSSTSFIPEISESYNFEHSSTSRHRYLAPNVNNAGGVDPFDTSTSCHLFRNTTNLQGPEPSEISLPRPFVPDATNIDGFEPSNISVRDEIVTEDIWSLFTTFNDGSQFLSENCEIGGSIALDAPDVNNLHVPDALESVAGPYSTGHPVRDTGSVEISQPRNEGRQRRRSKGLPAGPEPRQNNQQRKKANPNGVQRKPSSKRRRFDPKFRYFCTRPECKYSLEHGSEGFPSEHNAVRHGGTHSPEKPYVCPLSHTNGDARFRRPDSLKSHIKKRHSDRNLEDPYIKSILSKRYELPQVKDGKNVIIVKMRD
ncbi:hypothetical protein HO173_008139 [Letharia columbiana]|uniref:C2H2-type domain-containing protein n=1 Tax=Letharia columbiana TaxID=112416 RepID=A0A8H6L2Y3_9LECA|nr:uncharacterized protein HO173_008139 [Letharia columbiana]KAF6233582.1 hypothetical protein HO173_008139 [Letharia columbiana]